MDEMIDWNKFKSEAKGWNLSQAKKSYIELCELVNKNNHKLLSEYVGSTAKVLIDFNCGLNLIGLFQLAIKEEIDVRSVGVYASNKPKKI